MSTSDRRVFIGQLAAAMALPGLGSQASRAASPQQTPSSGTGSGAAIYDLLVAGGHVVDPSQQLSAIADVAIQGGRIARVAPGIPRVQARRVHDAAGRIVTPGLIDIHSHVYKYGVPLSTDADRVGILSGVTTIVDCGSTGANTFMAFRNYVIERTANRIYALLNISTIGLAVSNEIYLDPRMIDPKAALRMIEANRDLILGVKVRVRGRRADLANDVQVLKTAREVADTAGLPIMLHWTNEPDLLAILRRGDILTHPFNPPSVNFANVFGSDGRQEDKVLPQILELKARGIWIDGQAATTHHQWEISEKAVRQGWWPPARRSRCPVP
jgi:dihydroorotase